MATKVQIAANRRNARRSTGPRTSKGKSASSKNALRHGLTTGAWLLPGEDADSFARAYDTLQQDLRPQGALEEFLADRFALLAWRLMRAQRLEPSLLLYHSGALRADRALSAAQSAGAAAKRNKLADMLSEHGDYIDKEQQDQYEKHSEVARKAERERDAELLGGAFTHGCNSMSTLSRYETSIERSMFRALHQLQRLQGARQGLATPEPVAIDIDVSGTAQGGGRCERRRTSRRNI